MSSWSSEKFESCTNRAWRTICWSKNEIATPIVKDSISVNVPRSTRLSASTSSYNISDESESLRPLAKRPTVRMTFPVEDSKIDQRSNQRNIKSPWADNTLVRVQPSRVPQDDILHLHPEYSRGATTDQGAYNDGTQLRNG